MQAVCLDADADAFGAASAAEAVTVPTGCLDADADAAGAASPAEAVTAQSSSSLGSSS